LKNNSRMRKPSTKDKYMVGGKHYTEYEYILEDDDNKILINPEVDDMCYEYEIPSKILHWAPKKDNTCWLTLNPSQKAVPRLRNCAKYSEDACCNYTDDAEISDKREAMNPPSCLGTNRLDELEFWQCFSCRGPKGN
jgi:hypothetical protein